MARKQNAAQDTEQKHYEQRLIDKYVEAVGDVHLYQLDDPFTDRHGDGTMLNLLIGGSVVCGKACSAKEWADACNDVAEQHTGSRLDNFTKWSEDFAEFAASQEAAAQKHEKDQTDEDREKIWAVSAYIYLLDSYVLSGGGSIYPAEGQPYRVRTDQIQAWGFGMMRPDYG